MSPNDLRCRWHAERTLGVIHLVLQNRKRMYTLSPGNRVYWLDPENNRTRKATVDRIFTKKARIILTDFTSRSVALEELELAPVTGGLPLLEKLETPAVIELPTEESSITESVIEPDVIELPTEESSITESVIEPDVIELPTEESSITAGEINSINSVEGFNLYEVKKKGKTYHYWRYSYRIGSKTKHRHIGNHQRMAELRSLPYPKLKIILGIDR